jgi:hypothetical protein
MDKRQAADHPQDRRRTFVLELGLKGKFALKSTGWDENRVFLEGERLEVSVKNDRWVLCHVPARRPSRCCTTPPTTSDGATAASNGVALRCHLSTSRQATVSLMKRPSGYARPPVRSAEGRDPDGDLRRNPVEHGNIRVVESAGQVRPRATGLRYYDLRTRDHRGNFFDGSATARDQPQFIDSLNPASFSGALVSGTKRLGSRRPEEGRLRMF